MAATGYFEEPQSDESDFESRFSPSNPRVIHNRPYDEVFDVLKGDEPIDDEEEEINSDEEGPTTLQERRTPPLPNDGEDSVSTPHSGRGGLEAYDRSSHRFHVDASSGLTELGSINSSPQSLASNSARGAAQHRHLAVPIMEHNRSSDGSSVASSSGSPSVPSAAVSSPIAGVSPTQDFAVHKLIRANVELPTTRGYQAEDFAHLSVSEEIKDLFGYISRYHPHTVELETPLKPFIPELIPAVGEVDAALKIPPPSTGLKECMSADKTIVSVADVMSKLNGLGLVELDEPCLNQSDPAVVQLKLRSMTQCGNLDFLQVRKVAYPETINQREVDNWITQIEELHKDENAPSSVMNYSHKMPSIDQLMEAWPPEMEEYLSSSNAVLDPNPNLDVDLITYIRTICAMLDIPIHDNSTASIIDALHVLFTLYSDFASNPHFAASSPEQPIGDSVPPANIVEDRTSNVITE